jgi:simple sugar transport system substrate-binding protein
MWLKETRHRMAAVAAALIGAAVAVSGCTSSASSSQSGGGSGSGTTVTSASGGLIIDINGPLSDPFFGAMKQGADAAARQLGINYQYSAAKDETNVVPDYTALLQEAIGRHPAALVVGDFVPSTFDPYIRQATAQGIPVVIVNSGLSSWQADRALTFVGEEPVQAGHAAGQAAAQGGARHLLCVDHAPVNPALAQRCQGAASAMAAAGGTSAVLDIPAADNGNPAAVTQDIQGYLRSHPQIDGVMTQGAAIATDAVAAVGNLGKAGMIKVGTMDVSTAVLNDVKTGTLGWVIDQQGYLQGYYSLQIAEQYLRYKLTPTASINTSGLIITKTNVDAALAVQKQYPGLRGAA